MSDCVSRLMVDKVSPDMRSKIMGKIRKKDTKHELLLRKELYKRGFRYRIHYPILGVPDIAFPGKKVAIFCDGCFWHKCPKHFRLPKSRLDYWIPKIEGNVVRAKKIDKELKKMDWKVLHVWECEILDNPKKAANIVESELKSYKYLATASPTA